MFFESDIFKAILTLVIMEGLLSADNALVLSTMVNKIKDPELRKKALFYGMAGAVGFRAIFIFIGVLLVNLWWIKVLGAVYLFRLSYKHFAGKEDDEADPDAYKNTWMHKLLGKMGIHLSHFATVVISIEMMDLTFSLDSILASFAISTDFWVIFAGGVLGIIMMRGVAGFFIKLVNKVPEMEHTAYILIALIGLKMLLGTVHHIVSLVGIKMHEIHISHGLFLGIIVVLFGGTFIISSIKNRKNKAVQA